MTTLCQTCGIRIQDGTCQCPEVYERKIEELEGEVSRLRGILARPCQECDYLSPFESPVCTKCGAPNEGLTLFQLAEQISRLRALVKEALQWDWSCVRNGAVTPHRPPDVVMRRFAEWLDEE